MGARNIRLRAIGVGLIVGLAAGCAAPDPTGGGATAPPPGSGDTQPGVEAPDEIVIAYPSDIDNLDPHQFKSASAFAVVGNIYGTLLQESYTEPQDGVLHYARESAPYLAENAEWNADRTTLTFTLRDGVAFADGDPITSEDVVWSLQRAMSEISYGAAIGTWLNIEDPTSAIVATDDKTVQISVTHYSPLIEPFLAFPIFPALSKSAAEEVATEEDSWAMSLFTSGATESGPYFIESRVPGQSMTLRRNDSFLGADLARSAEKITLQTIPDPQQAFLALQNRAVDMVVQLTPDIAASVDSDPNLRLYRLPLADIVYLGFNHNDPALQDVRVRQAISYLIPYDTLRNEVARGYATTAYGPTPYPMRHSLDDTGEQVAYPTDPERARQLLADAGIDEGDLSLTLSVRSSDAPQRQAAVFIQSALSEAGINVSVQELSDSEFSQSLHSLQMFVSSWFSYGQDSVFQLFFLLTHGQFTNYTNYNNPELDALVAEAMATTDVEERDRLSKEAQQLVIDDAAWGFLYTREWLVGTHPDIEGLTVANDGNLRYHRLYFAR